MPTPSTCANCGSPISLFPGRIKKYKHHFCGNACAATYRLGHSKFDYDAPSSVVSVPCTQCHAPVEIKTSRLSKQNNVFCGRQCMGIYQSEHPRGTNKLEVRCHHCDETIRIWPSRYSPERHYYCSRNCKNKAAIKADNHITQICAACGKPYQTNIHQVTKRNGKYCSRQCMNTGMRSRDDVKAYYWRSIAKKIRKRDNYTCRLCGIHRTKPALDVHHIIPAASFGVDDADAANAPANLITLCRTCHRRVEVNPGLLAFAVF